MTEKPKSKNLKVQNGSPTLANNPFKQPEVEGELSA